MDSGVAQEYDVFTSTAERVVRLGVGGRLARRRRHQRRLPDLGRPDRHRRPGPRARRRHAPDRLHPDPPRSLLAPVADFHDILYGNNGDPAGPGYDLVTGLGTPVANLLVPGPRRVTSSPARSTITTEPPSTVGAGQTFGLTVQVEDSRGTPSPAAP